MIVVGWSMNIVIPARMLSSQAGQILLRIILNLKGLVRGMDEMDCGVRRVNAFTSTFPDHKVPFASVEGSLAERGRASCDHTIC